TRWSCRRGCRRGPCVPRGACSVRPGRELRWTLRFLRLLGDIAVRLTGGACARLGGIIACLQPAFRRAADGLAVRRPPASADRPHSSPRRTWRLTEPAELARRRLSTA